jgi:hypothetical protein
VLPKSRVTGDAAAAAIHIGNVTVERQGKLWASDAANAVALNDGDRHRASGGLAASPKNERGPYSRLGRIPDGL